MALGIKRCLVHALYAQHDGVCDCFILSGFGRVRNCTSGVRRSASLIYILKLCVNCECDVIMQIVQLPPPPHNDNDS